MKMDQSTTNGLSLLFEAPDIAAPSLQQQIQQLIQQRGALRHITVDSLQAEVNALKDDGQSDDGEVDGGQDENDLETPQVRQERLWKAREEMLQKLAYAQNEILSALDFVSLLLSGNSAAAQSSMSPALKQHVPKGTVNEQAVEKQEISASSRDRLNRVSEGWKSESFKSASIKFSQAAGRLESEAGRQSKYWDQIANLKSQGWSVSRLPSDSRAIGVHYGFPEAALQFRRKGFALLQQDEAGDLQLDPRSIPERFTSTRVAIFRDGKQTGTSQVRRFRWQPETTITEQMKQARDAIFEDELFYEVSREARLIANQKARTQPGAVEADIDERTQLRIIQTDSGDYMESQFSGSDDELAEMVILNLRLLLLMEHDKIRQRHSEPTLTMSPTPQVTPEYAIVRPILANLRHQASLSALREVGQSFAKTFASSRLQFKYQITDAGKEEQKAAGTQRLRMPARSLLAVQIGDGRQIEVEVETYLGSPVYGTVFRSRDLDFGVLVFQAVSYHTLEEAVEYLAHALMLELICQIPDFDVVRPHSGEVALNKTGKVTATISVRPQRLSLVAVGSSRAVFSWRPSGFQRVPTDTTVEHRSFMEIVHMLNSKV